MIRQALHRAFRQRFHDRNHGWQASILVNDIKNIINRMSASLGLRPASQFFSQRIEQRDAGVYICGNYRIADGVEGNRKFFFADLQTGVHLLQLLVSLLLNNQ